MLVIPEASHFGYSVTFCDSVGAVAGLVQNLLGGRAQPIRRPPWRPPFKGRSLHQNVPRTFLRSHQSRVPAEGLTPGQVSENPPPFTTGADMLSHHLFKRRSSRCRGACAVAFFAATVVLSGLVGCKDQPSVDEVWDEMDRVFDAGKPEADRLAACMLAAARPEAIQDIGRIDAENPSMLSDLRPHNPVRDLVTEALARHCGADMSTWKIRKPGIDPRGLGKNTITDTGILAVAYGAAEALFLKEIEASEPYKNGQAIHERKKEAARRLEQEQALAREQERQQKLKAFAVKEATP